jgi:phosphoenolpyruvate-protein kinase (PTS system EI component)
MASLPDGIDSPAFKTKHPSLREGSFSPVSEIKKDATPLVNGIAIGRAVVVDDLSANIEISTYKIAPSEIENELKLLDEAIKVVLYNIKNDTSRIEALQVQKSNMLKPQRIDGIRKLISEERCNVCHAIELQFDLERPKFEGTDLYPDFDQISMELLHAVKGSRCEISEKLEKMTDPFILCAQNLSAETVYAALKSGFLRGICIGDAGSSAHFRGVAQDHSIPTVTVNSFDIKQLIKEEVPLILDTQSGLLFMHPRPETYDTYARISSDTSVKLSQIRSPLFTPDSKELHVYATVSDFTKEPNEAVKYGAGGLGLFRLESSYFHKFTRLPFFEEEILTQFYGALFRMFENKPVQLRTFDFTDDKSLLRVKHALRNDLPSSEHTKYSTDELIAKYCLAPQIRAILRASVFHPSPRLYFPNVGTSERFIKRSGFVEQQKGIIEFKGQALNPNIEIGAMIESVEGIYNVHNIINAGAKFICVGSNDLLASVTSGNRLSDHLFPANPVVLKLIMEMNPAELTKKYGIDVSLCGNLAKAAYLPLVMAMGFNKISALTSEYGTVAEVMAASSASEFDSVLLEVLELESDLAVRTVLGAFHHEKAVEVHW